MIEIRETPEYLTEYHQDWEEDEIEFSYPRLFTLFADGRRVFTFSGESVDRVLASGGTLAKSEARVCLDGEVQEDAGDYSVDNWLERQGDDVVVLRGALTYTMQNVMLDERVTLLRFPFAQWEAAVDRLASLLAENDSRRTIIRES